MPDSEIPYNCRKQQSLPDLPAFAVVDFPNNNFVLYLLPFLPGSNSSKFYINDQLLCKSSLSLVRVCTPICPLLSLNNSPSEHLFHYIWVISVQVLASARLWPPEGWVVLHFLPAEPCTMCGPCLLISTCLCLIISWKTQSLDLIN